MADPTLLALFQELVTSYDSTISTAEGSAFRTSVIDPFLKRIGDSPLDVDLEAYVVDRLKTEHPTLDTSEGSGIRDLVLRPMVTMLAPLRREINAVALTQSLNNYEAMTREEVDSLLGNFFLSIQDGSLATGSVRVYFATPQASVIDSLVKFSTASGLSFFPRVVTSVTATTMALNRDGSLYYVDVLCEAGEKGTAYNISAGEITKVETIIGAVRVSNLFGFQSGVDDETKATAVTRARESITTRTLATSRGIKTLITESYANIDKLQVIGFGDPEMKRDLVEGPQSIAGIPGGFEGAADVDLASSIHIGGKTDVYAYQPSRAAQVLDIKNITDSGRRIVRGSSGGSPSTGSQDTFTDVNGQFSKNGVKPGDVLRFGSDTVALVETAILSVSDDTLTTGAGTIPFGLSNQTYEVVRNEDAKKYVDVSLFDLAAVDSNGDVVFEGASQDPVIPTPGSLSLSALTLGGTNQTKTINIASENAKSPIMQAISVDELDPTQLTLTGVSYPHADPLFAKSRTEFTGGTDPATATGSITFVAAPGGSSANVNDGDFLELEDRLGISQAFVFNQSGSYSLSSFTATGKNAQGSITCCAPTLISDGETVVINDGTNAYTFYFDKSGTFTPAVVDAQNIEVDISSETLASGVAAKLFAQINSSTILITATHSGGVTIDLNHDNAGAAANQNTKISDTVASSEFSSKGMLGGAVLVNISAASTKYDVAAAFRTALLANNLEITPGAAPVSGIGLLSLSADVAGSAGNTAITDGGSGLIEFTTSNFSGGTNGTKATGTVRVNFSGRVGALFPSTETVDFNRAAFTDSSGNVYQASSLGQVTATRIINSNTFTTPGDSTALLTRGTWVSRQSSGDLLYMVGTGATPTVHSSGTSTTTVRFDGAAGTFAYAAAGAITCDVHQGVSYQDIQQDVANGLFYVDVTVEASQVGTSYNAVSGSVFTTADIYSEGWVLRNLGAGTSFSPREKLYLRFSNYVNDKNLRKASAAYAIRLAYEHADTLSQIQDFVELDSNRIISEDILVKHFLPGMVGMKISLRGMTSASAQTSIDDFLSNLDPASTLEVSDLIDHLYSAGATYISLPIEVVTITPSQDRVRTASSTNDTVPIERVRHFVLDTSRLTITVLT